jgi:hypothetical protein
MHRIAELANGNNCPPPTTPVATVAATTELVTCTSVVTLSRSASVGVKAAGRGARVGAGVVVEFGGGGGGGTSSGDAIGVVDAGRCIGVRVPACGAAAGGVGVELADCVAVGGMSVVDGTRRFDITSYIVR